MPPRPSVLIFAVMFMPLLGACGGIPPAAPALSEAIEVRTAEEQRAYLALLDRYFELRRRELDRAFGEEYVPRFLQRVATGLADGGREPGELSTGEWVDVVRMLASARDSLHRVLENQRLEIVRRVRDEHALLREGQARLTLYLDARSDRDEAARELRERLGERLPLRSDDLLGRLSDVAGTLLPPPEPTPTDQ